MTDIRVELAAMPVLDLTTAIKLNERVVLRSQKKPIGSLRVEDVASSRASKNWLEQFGAESKINQKRNEYEGTDPKTTERPLCGSAETTARGRAHLAEYKVARD